MIRNTDLVEIAATQVNYAQSNMQPADCSSDAKLIATCILMAAHLIIDAIETAERRL